MCDKGVRNNYIDNLIDYWNGLKNVTKHKIKTARTYVSAATKLRHLIHGKFVEKYVLCDETLLDIDDCYLENYKFTTDEIKHGMDLLSLICTSGYALNGKLYHGKVKSLDGLLYNPMINKSMFLIVLSNPPTLSSKTEIDLKNLPYDREYFDMFYVLLAFKDRKPYTYKILSKNIQSVLSFHEKRHKFFRYERLYNLDYFMELYMNFLTSKYKYFNAGLVGLSSFSWNQFCNYIYDEFGENL